MNNENLLEILNGCDTRLAAELEKISVTDERYPKLIDHVAATRGLAEAILNHNDPFAGLPPVSEPELKPEGYPVPEPIQEAETWAPGGSDDTEDAAPTEESTVVPFPKPEPALTKTEVKARLTALANDNGVDVAKVMHDLGYQRLSDVPESRYAELLAKAEEAV